MPISDLISKPLVCLEPNSTLEEAAQLMKKHSVGGVLIVDSRQRPLGMVTDRDIALSVVADGKPTEMPVRDVMTRDVIKVRKHEGIAHAVDLMEDSSIRRMVVTDEDGAACGLVSADDILQLVAREIYGLGKMVRRQSGLSEKWDSNPPVQR